MFPFVCCRKLQDLELGATRGELHTFLLEIVQSSTNLTNTKRQEMHTQLQTFSEIQVCFWMLHFFVVAAFVLLVLFKKNDDCLLDTIRTYDTVFTAITSLLWQADSVQSK